MSVKFCKDCKHRDDIYCDAPNAPKINPEDGLPVTIFTTQIARWNPEFCGMAGKWFEAKAPEQPEEWRWVCDGETFEDQDVFHPLNKPINSCLVGSRCSTNKTYRRRITLEIEKCPEGHEAILSWWYGGFRVHCDLGESYQWITPQYKTKDEAVSAWNAVMRAYREAREKAGEGGK